MKQIHFTIHGKVQGVWFRAWTQDLAKEMGVTGWVRNMSDGNVEGTAMGDNELLAKFLDRLHDGQPLARVNMNGRDSYPNLKTHMMQIRKAVILSTGTISLLLAGVMLTLPLPTFGAAGDVMIG